jgi:hypothetical protein
MPHNQFLVKKRQWGLTITKGDKLEEPKSHNW